MTASALTLMAQTVVGISRGIFVGVPVTVLLLLIVAAAAVMILRRRALPGLAPGRRPRPRHIVVRILCGALGAAILVAVAVGTIREASRCYAPLDVSAGLTVKVPTMPPPPIDADIPMRGGSSDVTQKTRFLASIVAVDFMSGRPLPLAAQQFEIAWPDDRGREYAVSLEAGDLRLEATFSMGHLLAYRDGGEPDLKLRPSGSFRFRLEGGSGTQGGMGGWLDTVSRLVGGPYWPRSVHPLSVVSGTATRPLFYSIVLPVASDDPLRDAPLAEWVTSHEEDLAGARISEWDPPGRLGRSTADDHLPARGIVLAEHLGISALLLLVAAILLTQVFTNRALVFPALLAGVILFVAALDRVALGTHLARLDDASAPAAVRGVACIQATETFFYGKTALARIEAVAKDEASPKELKGLAAQAAARMRERIR